MLLLMLSSLLTADPIGEDPAAAATATIQRALITPLAQAEAKRTRFSRVRIPPRERSIDVTSVAKDKTGAEFFPFSVSEMKLPSLTGCVYVATGEVFIKRGDAHYPATFLLGKTKDPAAAHVCSARPTAMAAAPTTDK
ncbi:MAG: hypothetical protein IT381_22295 [Deltaproteobacteria bacterium]|nr:hypothetical protein [Deltaproteobacteria bacterium]